MVQTDCGLDQALIESTRVALLLGPQLFPDFVCLEEVAPVEILDAFQVMRIILGRVKHVGIFAELPLP